MVEILFASVATMLMLATFTGLIRARALGWGVPVWFVVSILGTELAPRLLVVQLVLAAVGAWFLDIDSSAVQWGLVCLSLASLGTLELLRRHFEAGSTFERALNTGLGADFREQIPADRRATLSHQIRAKEWLRPLKFARDGVKIDRDISYGPAGKRNLLDIYSPVTAGENRPVLLQIHGGAWILGHKAEQALPLLHHMPLRGWVVVSINYRLSPRATFPDHIIDVKRAIAWIREHITEWGGDPDFIAVTGGSAGGHLTALAALSSNYAPWQPGFEHADTSLQAALPLYGAYDLCNRFAIRQNTGIVEPVMKRFMKATQDEDPERYELASPLSWLKPGQPPFFVVQGCNDTLIWVEEARRFVAEFSEHSGSSLVYAELEGAQHSFDCFHSPRTSHYLNAAAAWLEWARANHELKR